MSEELEKGLYSMIAGASPQSSAGSRVYPRIPQSPTYPLIRYQRITTARKHAIDGPVGVTDAIVQVDCIATSYSESKALADTIRTLLHFYRGSWGTLTARLVSLESDNDFNDQDGDRVRHWVTQRFRIWTDMD